MHMNSLQHNRNHRQWLKLALRVFTLYLNQQDQSRLLLQNGYDQVAKYYDTYWTQPISNYSKKMVQILNPVKNSRSLDLTCGRISRTR